MEKVKSNQVAVIDCCHLHGVLKKSMHLKDKTKTCDFRWRITVLWIHCLYTVVFLTLNVLVAITSKQASFPQSDHYLRLWKDGLVIPWYMGSWRCKFGIPGLEPLCYIFEEFLVPLMNKRYFWSKYRLCTSVGF